MMPASYGMGKYSYREYAEKIILNNENYDIWEKLKKNKNNISDYIWDNTNEILKNIGYDLEEYKEHCKNHYKNEDYEALSWQTDIGITVIPTII